MIDILESINKKWFDFFSENPEATIFHQLTGLRTILYI
jgi:hypothetical protein